MAFRSIIDHGATIEIPDMRIPAVRTKYRDDYYCTDPRTPEKFRLPTTKSGTPEVPDNIYDAVKSKFLNIDLTVGGK